MVHGYWSENPRTSNRKSPCWINCNPQIYSEFSLFPLWFFRFRFFYIVSCCLRLLTFVHSFTNSLSTHGVEKFFKKIFLHILVLSFWSWIHTQNLLPLPNPSSKSLGNKIAPPRKSTYQAPISASKEKSIIVRDSEPFDAYPPHFEVHIKDVGKGLRKGRSLLAIAPEAGTKGYETQLPAEGQLL